MVIGRLRAIAPPASNTGALYTNKCNVLTNKLSCSKQPNMKKLLFLVVILGLTQFNCKKSSKTDFISESLAGKWRMIIVKDNSTGSVTTKPTSIQNDVDITFTFTSTTRGTFNGNTPTNEIGKSDYSIGANQTITIHDLLMTQISETSWGNEFVKNFGSSQKYSFEIGGRLSITTISKTLTFKKQ